MSEPLNRWFPGETEPPVFEYGWVLNAGERWNAEDHERVSLTCLEFQARSLDVKFYIDARTSISLHFDQVADLQIDGAFEFGWRPEGWDVMGTPMLVGQRPRSDGRLVYVIELSNSLICIASLPGTLKSVPSPPPAVFVIDGHDIDLYPDAEGAAREIEGYTPSPWSTSARMAPSTGRPLKGLSGEPSPCIARISIVWTS